MMINKLPSIKEFALNNLKEVFERVKDIIERDKKEELME